MLVAAADVHLLLQKPTDLEVSIRQCAELEKNLSALEVWLQQLDPEQAIKGYTAAAIKFLDLADSSKPPIRPIKALESARPYIKRLVTQLGERLLSARSSDCDTFEGLRIGFVVLSTSLTPILDVLSKEGT